MDEYLIEGDKVITSILPWDKYSIKDHKIIASILPWDDISEIIMDMSIGIYKLECFMTIGELKTHTDILETYENAKAEILFAERERRLVFCQTSKLDLLSMLDYDEEDY